MPSEIIKADPRPTSEQSRDILASMVSGLWPDLLTEDTWAFRQAGVYGMPFTSTDYDVQDQLIAREIEKLGSRAGYINKAYHLIDNLNLHMAWTSLEVESLEKWLTRASGEIDKLSQEYEEFLENEASNAFQVIFDLTDKDNPQLSIEDRELDTKELKRKWDKFSKELKSVLPGQEV